MENTNNTTKQIDIYSMVNDKIIAHLEKGVIPWKQPWTSAGIPQNLISKRHYQGINFMLLNMPQYDQNYFLTFKQVQELGASVKKGEHGHHVVYWKWLERENEETKEIEKVPMVNYYKVFNVSQCTGISDKMVPKIEEDKNNPIKSCEEIIDKMHNKPDIKYGNEDAGYFPKQDYIQMPERKYFNNSENYYETLFHELVHSTGHTTRLNRKELMDSKYFGSELYAKEELTAEIGASYLKSLAGLPMDQLENNASYIQSWLTKLKNDKKLIVQASSQAQRATDYILGLERERELEAVRANSKEKNMNIEKAL